MLQHITISHYALIEHLDIDWESGFSVITGETGAGKSIILGALNLLLGGRSDTRIIQTGHKKCIVEAIFNIKNQNLRNWFKDADIEYDEKECIIRREVSCTGKSRAFINDTPVAVTLLKELGSKLIDIHSQHQNLLIQNENFLINILDILAHEPQLLSDYQNKYDICKEAESKLEQLKQQAVQGKEEIEYKQFLLSQLQEANLSEEEQEKFEEELNVLSHAEEIKQSLSNAYNILNTDNLSVNEQIKQASNTLNSISENFDEASTLISRLNSVSIELNDIETELSQKAEAIDCDPERLIYVEDRLNTIYGLEQKHHVDSIHELLIIANDLLNQINRYDSIDNDIEQLEKEVIILQSDRNLLADQLTQVRIKASTQAVKELTEALKNLGMPNICIEIQITPRNVMDKSGNDNVIFLFSANKNVPPQDVSKIASGGEIARLMLTIKSIIAKRINLPTIIFDEIDTGVSGTMAQRMAQVMQQISKTCQVICITHLPQIASLGKNQFKVYKEDKEDSTYSHIIPLTKEQRIEEIAHMLSGEIITEAAYNNAKELLLNN